MRAPFFVDCPARKAHNRGRLCKTTRPLSMFEAGPRLGPGRPVYNGGLVGRAGGAFP